MRRIRRALALGSNPRTAQLEVTVKNPRRRTSNLQILLRCLAYPSHSTQPAHEDPLVGLGWHLRQSFGASFAVLLESSAAARPQTAVQTILLGQRPTSWETVGLICQCRFQLVHRLPNVLVHELVGVVCCSSDMSTLPHTSCLYVL